MSFSIEFADEMASYQARIKVIGCGGSGGNAVNTMIHFGLEGVEFIAVNTDAQALNANLAPVKIPIGGGVTKGLGAGSDPERGRKAALEDVNRLKEAISGADMVFVTAGMGGGTGTGSAPIVAQLAREEGALTVGVVTKPFIFEGRQRARRAELGLQLLTDHVDTLITIPNEKLVSLADDNLTFMDAFRKADEVLFQAIKGISDLITQEGIVNVDFADVRAVMAGMGRALMGTGCAKGDGRARLAAQEAITSPLLDDISVDGATGVLINIVGGPDMKMREIQEAATLVQEQAHEDANIIFGATVDESMADMLKVTVIATGFDRQNEEHAHLMKQASRQPMEREAAPQTRTSYSFAPHHQEPQPAYSIRKPAPSVQQHAHGHAHPHSSVPPASSVGQTQLPNVRERITFPSSSAQASMDHEWDIPTFQRRGGG
jgi:cell division protein FtsZ